MLSNLPMVIFGVLAASVLRGFTGFGFGLAAVPLLSIVLPPTRVVPFVTVLQVIVGLQGLRAALPLTRWRLLLGLAPGLLAGIPLGLLILTEFSPNRVRLAIGLLIAASVIVLQRRIALPPRPSRAVAFTVGLLSGTMNGLASMGGPPIVVYLLALAPSTAVVRASSIVWFLFASVITALPMAARGLVDREILLWSAASLPVMLVGTTLGSWGFHRSRPHHHRLVALVLLSIIAVGLIARALAG